MTLPNCHSEGAERLNESQGGEEGRPMLNISTPTRYIRFAQYDNGLSMTKRNVFASHSDEAIQSGT